MQRHDGLLCATLAECIKKDLYILFNVGTMAITSLMVSTVVQKSDCHLLGNSSSTKVGSSIDGATWNESSDQEMTFNLTSSLSNGNSSLAESDPLKYDERVMCEIRIAMTCSMIVGLIQVCGSLFCLILLFSYLFLTSYSY